MIRFRRNRPTTIRIPTNDISARATPPMDWRIVAGGHLNAYLYRENVLKSKIPFKELRLKRRVDNYMEPLGENNFSQNIRNLIPQWQHKITIHQVDSYFSQVIRTVSINSSVFFE